MMLNFDVLIIGSGLAGLSSAIKLADNKKIAIISKKELSVSSSQWAQGGIASAISEEDSVAAHINDTLSAGAGLCDEAVVSFVANRSQEALKWLAEIGVDFTKDQIKNDLHLTKEGGHSYRRVAHVADATGRAVQNVLINKIKEHPNVTIFEDHIAVDLITSNKIEVKTNHKNSPMPAKKTPQTNAWPALGKYGVAKSRAPIRNKFRIIGVAATAAKRPSEFRTPPSSDTSETNKR